MLFYTLLPILLLGASAFAQKLDSPSPAVLPTDAAAEAKIDAKIAAEQQQPQGTSITVTELDTSEPMLWQMAAFAARQMSTKQRRFKLATLSAAEQIDSLTRLKVTLQRMNEGAPFDKNDLLYCNVEVKSNAQGQQWEVDNFGCTLPAMVRRRRPQKKIVVEQAVAEPITTNKFDSPIDNEISDNQIDSKPTVAKTQVKRQTVAYRPYFQQPSYVPTFYQPQQQYPVYYQTYY